MTEKAVLVMGVEMANAREAGKGVRRSPVERWLKTERGGWLGGVLFTVVVAACGTGLAKLPGLDRIGPLACAILIAVLYRQMLGYPETIRRGIQFSGKRLLRLAIVLYGLKLNIDVIVHQGLGLLVRDAGTIVFSIGVMLLLAKWLKADIGIALLLGVGTGVCGAAAIAAVSPIVKSKEEDTAISVGIIALLGTVFAIAYTLLRPLLPLSAMNYGIWTGVSIHEVAQVALAAAPAGADPLAMALLAKLGRVFMLVPLSLVLMYWMRRKGKLAEGQAKIEFPWFLVGFLLMSVFGSYVLGKSVPLSAGLANGLSNVSAFVLTTAMVGLGLNVNLKDLRTRALRPLVAMVITSVALSILSFVTLF